MMENMLFIMIAACGVFNEYVEIIITQQPGLDKKTGKRCVMLMLSCWVGKDVDEKIFNYCESQERRIVRNDENMALLKKMGEGMVGVLERDYGLKMLRGQAAMTHRHNLFAVK